MQKSKFPMGMSKASLFCIYRYYRVSEILDLSSETDKAGVTIDGISGRKFRSRKYKSRVRFYFNQPIVNRESQSQSIQLIS